MPTIIRLLEKRDSTGKTFFIKICQKQSLVKFPFVSDRQYHIAAVRGIILFGKNGDAALPALRDGLQRIGTNRNEFAAAVWRLIEETHQVEGRRFRPDKL